MARTVEIIRSDVIILHHDPQNINQDDDYFHFADEGGQTYRIKNNRTQSIELITDNLGRAVKLNYGSYNNREYIHTVELVAGKLPPPKPPATDMIEPKAEKTTQPEKTPAPPIPILPSGQATGMVTNNITSLIVAGVQSKDSITAILDALYGKETALELIKWWRGQFLSITRVTYDGAKLPSFCKKHEP